MAEIPQQVPVTRKSGYRPILLTLVSSLVLGGGSCAGFLKTLNFNGSNWISGLFALVFVLCASTFVGSLIWLVVKAIRDSIQSPDGPR